MTRRLPVFGLLLLGACNAPRPAPETSSGPEPIEFEMMTKEKTYENCVAGAAGCTYIRFDYPVVVEAPLGTAVEAVTETVTSFLLEPVREDGSPTTITALMDQFIFDFMAFKEEYPDSERSWFLERKALVHENAPEVLSLSFTERSLMGGERVTESIHFANLDPRSGASILLSDLLEPDSEEELTSIAEARFRAVRGIEKGVSLTEAGFTFESGEFALTDNFAIGEDALTFYYNTEEIAVYDMGATELVIPYETIEGLIERPQGPALESSPP